MINSAKYSPTLTRTLSKRDKNTTFVYDHNKQYSTEHGIYDADGYNIYGYSAYDSDGTYVGPGIGVDRAGHTESDYNNMPPDIFMDYMI